jgi:hypothetical protein
VFHMDATKVGHDVAYVTTVVYICCNYLFQIIHLFFLCMLQACLSRCPCVLSLHMFSNCFSSVSVVLDVYVASDLSKYCKNRSSVAT